MKRENGNMYKMIAAVDQAYGLGYKNALAWSFAQDMRHFKDYTSTGICVFGHNTWFSLPEKAKDRLRNRSYVLTGRQIDFLKPEGVAHIRKDNIGLIDGATICGGAATYRWALENLDISEIMLTSVSMKCKCDVFFPKEYLHWYASADMYFTTDVDRLSGETIQLHFNRFVRKDLV
jgi:dihydrofolate reductase